MAIFAIGDIQGCVMPLEQLLERIGFDPLHDQLWLTGDLINRGPNSLATLQLLRSFGDCVIAVLGNHDLHFLAVASGVQRARSNDTLSTLLKSSDLGDIVDWIRSRPLMHCDKSIKTVLVHAGIYPGWSRKRAKSLASEVESALRGDDYVDFIQAMYGNRPSKWNPDMGPKERFRFIVNAFTRMRYCDRKGNLNLAQKGSPGSQPKRYRPWFELDNVKCKGWRIVFGHWASLGCRQMGRFISLDSGCVWGGRLTATRLDDQFYAPMWHIGCTGQQ